MVHNLEYIIIGDTDRFSNCLVYVCGKSKENAENVLSRILTEPTEQDKRMLEEHKNLRVKEVQSEKCWWNHGCD